MSTMRSLLGIFVVCLVSMGALAAEVSQVQARADGYLQGMLAGDRTSLVNQRDYYGLVYVVKSAGIKSMKKISAREYEVVVVFQVSEIIKQNAEDGKFESSRSAAVGALERTLRFEFDKDAPALRWTTRLSAPFVLSGKESRYLLKSH